MTPLSVRKVKPTTADIETDGLGEPDLRAGKRKGLRFTLRGINTLKGIKAKRLKRMFNGADRTNIEMSVCSACGSLVKIIAESRIAALNIRWSLTKYCRTWKEAASQPQGPQSVLVHHARRRQGFACHLKSHGARLGMVGVLCLLYSPWPVPNSSTLTPLLPPYCRSRYF